MNASYFLFVHVCTCTFIVYACLPLQLLENMESKMKATVVENTIPRLFEGKTLVIQLWK